MIKQDYKPQNNQEFSRSSLKSSFPKWLTHPFLIIGMAVCILLLALVLSDSDKKSDAILVVEEVNNIVEQKKRYSTPVEINLELKNNTATQPQATPIAASPVLSVQDEWLSESVKKGDNLSLIFKRIGLTPQQVHQVITLDDNTQLLKRLKPGEVISYKLDDNNNLLALKYIINIQQTLYIDLLDEQLSSRIENKSIEYRTAYAQGKIDDSLFMAGKKAGLTDTQVMQLANIFDWDIDFILDIRKGDSFSMLYQEEYVEGEKIGNGAILAAEFINQGKRFSAVRYTDEKDNSSYYTPQGLSMRKAFLRAPLKFSYISSNFKPRRFHPILKRWKAHKGIDYRASTGTPIRAAGDGRVIASSYSKYNGKYVFIQHGQGIVTKYLHMSRRAVSKNKRVKQGQVIGYVGATGLAEAPHLHYEFLVNGVHRNPRTVKLPKAKPIDKAEKDRFLKTTKPWIEQLASRNQLLNNEETIAP
ncbi:OapA family protein [Aliikangiella sp. IMCC44359]|uniref:OapA family protein n=1 Tax=Aliikangiella sp. IMCC44359 TaxID=3459125 RepID=UPI00403B258C